MFLNARIREYHAYIGMFIAPSIIFFAITGALQIFDLHEAHVEYTPPVILEKLGRLHKDQVFAERRRESPSPPASSPSVQEATGSSAAQAPSDDSDDVTPLPTTILKIYFTVVAIALVISTLFGLWIGLKRSDRRGTSLILLVVGTSIPILLLVS